MISDNTNRLAIQRLTALWALNESGLGGLLHAFNSPFTGLIVGGIAVVLISLICLLAKHKWSEITMALTIVLIVKAAVAPHSSLTAYIAVSFQAILGVIMYSVFGMRMMTSILFATIALVESALQKLLVIWLVYGETFFKAVDDFGVWVAARYGTTYPLLNASSLVFIYIMVYACGGFITGIFVSRLIKSIRANWHDPQFAIRLSVAEQSPDIQGNRKKRPGRYFLYVMVTVTLLMLMVYAYTTGGWMKGIFIFGRAVIVLTLWYVVIAPWLFRHLKKYLDARRSQLSEQIDHVFDMIPYLKTILRRAWQESKQYYFFSKWYQFILRSILYTLHFKIEE